MVYTRFIIRYRFIGGANRYNNANGAGGGYGGQSNGGANGGG